MRCRSFWSALLFHQIGPGGNQSAADDMATAPRRSAHSVFLPQFGSRQKFGQAEVPVFCAGIPAAGRGPATATADRSGDCPDPQLGCGERARSKSPRSLRL